MSSPKTILTVLGTRPEIVKFSPLLPEFDRHYRHVLVHTGQHYDENMDRIFFRELKLRMPRHFLNVGSGSQGAQTGRMLERLEPLMAKHKPDCVMVLGDTNSTLAGGLVAAKLHVPIAHVESGCRSFNMRMPEEVNRVMVDHVSEWLFAPDAQAVRQLKDEGVSARKIHLVGNTGLDATRRIMGMISPQRLRKFNVKPEQYAMVTLHRAENTDDPKRFAGLIDALNQISKTIPLLFPVHPRTRGALKRHGLKLDRRIRELPALGSLDFIALLKHSIFVMSDSGGIQEEAAVVNKPCLVLREETEWMRLVEAGKNLLVGTHPRAIVSAARRLASSSALRREIARKKAPLSFGATKRIMQILRARKA